MKSFVYDKVTNTLGEELPEVEIISYMTYNTPAIVHIYADVYQEFPSRMDIIGINNHVYLIADAKLHAIENNIHIYHAYAIHNVPRTDVLGVIHHFQ